jgi:DNA-binding transcriptional MerR regulator
MKPMNEEPNGLLSIGAFARRSKLSISALRFYGDAGVLVPARTDPATGYRYYGEDQLSNAELIRNLRALEMPIQEIQSFLAADPTAAEAILVQHWRRLRVRMKKSRRALDAVQSLLRGKEKGMSATASVEGGTLAGAIRQVLPAAGPLGPDRRYPAAVLIDFREDGLRLAATDGHRLCVRDLPAPVDEQGQTVIGIDDAEKLASVVDGPGQVTLTAKRTLSVRTPGDLVEFSAASDHYPDYEAILGRCGSAKLLVKTGELVSRLERAREVTTLNLRDGSASIDGNQFSARYIGPALRIGFNPDYLIEGLRAGIGPDVILRLGGPLDPVAISSADDGALTWLVMPVRLKEAAKT